MRTEWRRERADILGVNVSAITMDDAVAAIAAWIRERTSNYICVTGVHGVMECQRDPDLLNIHNASGLTVPDGMPLVWMSRKLGFPWVERVYGPDLMRRMTALSAARGYRNFYCGGGEGVADELKTILQRAHPGLNVVGTFCPPFRPLTAAEDVELVATINAARPDIVWVGLSTPKQERWMSAHIGRLEAPVLVGVGAAFDFLSGRKSQAPAWMQRRGLEWLYRMASEPRRLAGRYVRNNPVFIYKSLRQLLLAVKYRQENTSYILKR